MFDIDDLLIYHPNIILTSDVYDILDNMDKYLCNWTFNFRKVVQQQICGEVVDFNLAFFSSSENVTVKTLLKSVYIYQSYCKKNLSQFFWPTLYLDNLANADCWWSGWIMRLFTIEGRRTVCHQTLG